MKRIATVFTFGLCTVSAKGAAEPRNPNLPAHHAKAALGIESHFEMRNFRAGNNEVTLKIIAKTLQPPVSLKRSR